MLYGYLLNFENKIYCYASIDDNLEQTPSEYKSSHHLSQGYHYMDGTSMAAPHVTVVAALLLTMNPNLTVEQIKTAIINGTNLHANVDIQVVLI